MDSSFRFLAACLRTLATPLQEHQCASHHAAQVGKMRNAGQSPGHAENSSMPAYRVANSHAGMGIGGIKGMTLRLGNMKA